MAVLQTCSGLPVFYSKKDGVHVRVTLWNVPSDDNVPRKTCFFTLFPKKGTKASTVVIYINLFFRMNITQDGNKSSVKVQPADSWRNRLAYSQDGRLFLT